MPNEEIHPVQPPKPKKKLPVAEDGYNAIYYPSGTATLADAKLDVPPAKPAPIPTPWDQPVPPGERISFLGKRSKNSVESNWMMLKGLGWAYYTEMDHVTANYRESAISGMFYRRSEMHRLQEGGAIHESEAKDPRILTDDYAGNMFKKENKYPGKAIGREGQDITVSKSTVEQYFVECHELKVMCPSDHCYQIKTPQGIIMVSNVYYKKNCVDRIGNKKPGAKYVRCHSCEKMFLAAQAPHRPDIGGHHCDACYNKKRYANAVRAHDDHRFLPKLHEKRFNLRKGIKTEIPSPRLFGVECELGFSDAFVRDKVAREINDLLGVEFCYMKHDGSINNHGKGGEGVPFQGFEIVTAPADIDIHRRKWPILEQYENYKNLRSWDTSTCGMHVHVSRDALNCLQISRILVFINHPENKKFIQQVAGRGELKWTRYYDKGLTSSLHPEASGDRDMDRRVAVNLQNEHTIEFRIFRGTINPRHIIRNIEFVDAVCDFCHPCDRSFKELLNYKNFVRFCEDRKKSYPLFAQWAMVEKHMRARKPAPGAVPIQVEELKPQKKQLDEGNY